MCTGIRCTLLVSQSSNLFGRHRIITSVSYAPFTCDTLTSSRFNPLYVFGRPYAAQSRAQSLFIAVKKKYGGGNPADSGDNRLYAIMPEQCSYVSSVYLPNPLEFLVAQLRNMNVRTKSFIGSGKLMLYAYVSTLRQLAPYVRRVKSLSVHFRILHR